MRGNDEGRSNKLIMIPYAEIVDANTGVNITKKDKRQETYLKNCCVSACSAKNNNPECDVAVVTNIDIPKEYKNLLQHYGVLIFCVSFDRFFFGNSYTWSLAFYKLCALYHVSRCYEYQYYAYLDADVYVQRSFADIWTECDHHIMLYDICHGLQVKDYCTISDEFAEFDQTKKLITHYGGEFFAADRKNAQLFSQRCEEIYLEMLARNTKTTKGDEFIVSLAASEFAGLVKNAGAYIFRFWTGKFNLVSTCYRFNPITVLHIPAEKERGIICLYDRFYRKGLIPNNEKVYRILHLRSHSALKRIGFGIRVAIRGLIKR